MDGAQAASPRRPSAQASSSLEASYDVRDGKTVCATGTFTDVGVTNVGGLVKGKYV